MDRLNQTIPRGRPVSSVDAAKANDVLERFINAGTLKTILGSYRHMCELLHLKPNVFPLFYPKLKANLNSWKAKAVWKKFDARVGHKCYARGKVCPNTRVLIIGAGPCGLRTAIEAQLLGAKVVVIEKRDRMSRNNVLHLWPFVIEDLRALGAKKFFGKFCAGAIDHISIRQLQCILMKAALLLGVEIHTEVSFEKLVEPNSTEKIGWRAEFKPSEHPVSQYEFDVIIGADGKRNTLQGFKRKEFRGKLAIAITANFINKRTEAEARVEEISGVAFIFNQKFFKELNAETGIDLENIVYYKDDTHYFVMTAKKPSLIDKGVIKQDYADTARLLSPDNVDREALMNYAREAADFSTNYQMSDMEFAVNHYGQPDVAMFDFTSMYAAENASKVIERHGYKLLMTLVGDSLLEPFWPTGSGCARGFLSSLDACWAIKAWGSGVTTPLEVLAERESIYRLLAQTTPENLNKDCKAYTVDPSSRYPNLNKALLLPQQVLTLYDTDDPSGIELTSRAPQPVTTTESHRKRRRRDMHLDPNTLISWIKEQIREYEDLTVEDVTTSFRDGRVLCAILHHYRPDLVDYSAIKPEDVGKNNQLAFDLLEKEIGISPVMTGDDMANAEVPDYLTMFSYLTQIYDTFRGEIPHIKHPKLDLPETKENVRDVPMNASARSTDTTGAVITRYTNRPKRHAEPISSNKPTISAERKPKKRRSFEKYDMGMAERLQRLEDIASNRADRQNKRRQQRRKQTEQFIKSMQMLQMNAKPDASGPFEDYSIFVYRQTAPHFQDRVKNLEKQFTYVPDRENRLPSQSRAAGADEELAARIKDLEDKWRDPVHIDKKPKDLMRAIGKIETSDWNIKEIEKKIMENKLGKSVNKEKERVPKWNREQFLARQTRLEKLDRQSSAEAKFSEVDKSIKHLEQRLKEGSVRDQGQNKVASITEKLATKSVEPESTKPIQKTSNPKPAVVLPTQGGSEYCHFCQKRVYLMERLSAEGRFFHRGCFKCQYCHTTLRLGSYLFDRDGQYGHRFYCSQHFGMAGELYPIRTDAKVSQKITREHVKPLDKLKMPLTGVEGVDLLDRVQTPERIEFANLSAGHISSDHDESLSQMDEDEWTDRNFGASTAEVCSSDEEQDSSSLSGSESDNEDAYEEALEEPPTKEGTLRWMKRYQQKYSKDRRGADDSDSDDYSSSSDHSSYYENSSGDEADEPATEGEEEIRARELRKQEVRVEPPVVQTDTGSDTEIVSDESSPESDSKHNSATEISTDSEFAVDEPTPTREIPSIIFNDFNVTKSRGNYGPPKKVQVKSAVLQSPINGKTPKRGIQLEFTPLVSSPVLPKPAPTSLLARTEGYALNRTQSTGGIATKVSLELKKKYLLGDTGVPGNIQKSGSVSTLDSKFKSFHTNISDCQKLLKPAPEVSSSMQVFCSTLNERRSPLSPISSQSSPFSDKQKSPDIVNPRLSPSETKPIEIIDLTVSPEQPDVTKCTKEPSPVVEDKPAVFQHELEGRPRSPVQEIPIIVPKIDWSQANKTKDSDISSDSLTSDTDSDEHTGIQKSPTVKIFNSIPRVEVHNDAGEILRNSTDEIALDSLCPVPKQESKPKTANDIQTSMNDSPKSITSEKKSLNQPKTLPGLQKDHVLPEIHTELHERGKISPEGEQKYITIASGQSTPSEHDSYVEHTTAAMTETELSDWARDSAVSDDFEDVEFELNPDFVSVRKNRQPKGIKKSNESDSIIKANMAEFDDMGHVCGKEKQMKDMKNKISLTENLSNIMSSIEFMDTGEETSSDEKVLVEATMKNNGYVEFQNEDDIAEDSLNPNINNVIDTVNPEIRDTLDLNNLSSYEKNTGYCIIGNEDNFGGEMVELKETDLEKLKEKQSLCENEEDSLLIVETGTTTEENTCSDSTVKNIIEMVSEKEKKDLLNATSLINENKSLLEKIRVEQNIPQSDQQKMEIGQQTKELVEDSNKHEDANNVEYEEHCQRLQSKVEFGNVRDSIDIRKSKRKDKSELPPKPDLIQEETLSPVHVQLEASSPKTPKAIYTKEEIKKVRDENQKFVQEMVMNKMKAQNRSLERKKRSRNSFSPSRPFDLNKSATTDIASQIKLETDKDEKRISTYSTSSSVYSTPDVLLSTNNAPKRQHIPLEKSHTITAITELNKSNLQSYQPDTKEIATPVSSLKQHPKSFTKQLSIHSSFQSKPKTNKLNSSLPDTPLTNPEAFSLPDIQQALLDDFKTPKAPPRQKNEDALRTAEKLKQDARAKARLMSNEDLGLSPEDKLRKLREKISKRGKENETVDVHIQDSIESLVINTEKRNSLLYSNDTLTKKRNHSFKRSKSGDDALHSHNTFSSSDLGKLSIKQTNAYPVRTKSVSEIPKSFVDVKLMEMDLNAAHEEKINKLQYCKSDPNLLTETYGKTEKKKTKDRERRKSITRLISEFFGKKKDGAKTPSGSTSKGFLSRISPKSKSKSMINLTGKNADKATGEIPRTNSFSEPHHRRIDNVSPPPIPPLPLNYTGSGPSRCTDDSSDGENEWRHQERSSCDTLDQSGIHEGRRVSRSARKAARQAQLKRHRMAQEIQRKLEETEVKTRELEQRGVMVEKALRGETNDANSTRDECDLLKEWFDLMRDLTELRRYERELMVRAQELELEDRHARLQQELRERLDNDDHKTKEDVKAESSIINEMMEIVAKRDSLISLLEQDRLRYSEEDRDFEEQMLAKGLRLTPLQKNSDK